MSNVLIGLVGDVLVHRHDPPSVFREVRDALAAPRILFANLEGPYSDDPRAPLGVSAVAVTPPAQNLEAYAPCGFNVMSMANNHIMDAGHEAMLETRARLRARGIHTCGAGECLAEAREPAIVEADGLRVAFLAYASMFPIGYNARSKSPGLAPMRAYNFYRELSADAYRPGAQPLITTVPDATDAAHLEQDIRAARACADVVIMSFHWGDHRRPFHLTDHETRTARYCIDSGADMVVGHHHHALRGMEWYRGKPILYGLGHFVFDLRLELTDEIKALISQRDPDDSHYEIGPREGWPLLPLHEDTRMTVLAYATATRSGISDIGFLPCRLTPDGLVHPLEPGSKESDEVVRYLEKCNTSQRLNGRIVTDGATRLASYQTMRVVPK